MASVGALPQRISNDGVGNQDGAPAVDEDTRAATSACVNHHYKRSISCSVLQSLRYYCTTTLTRGACVLDDEKMWLLLMIF